MPIHPLSITVSCKTCGTSYKAIISVVNDAGQTCTTEELEKIVEVLLKHDSPEKI